LRKKRAEGIVRRGSPDYILFFTVLTILALGIVMVFSASMVKSIRFYDSPYHFLMRQSLWASIGLSAMLFLMNFDCWRYRRFIPHLYALSVLMLVLVLVPGIGQVREGARRWLGFGTLGFQPAELAKATTVLFLADSLARTKDRIRHFAKGLGPYLIAVGITFALVFLEPDLGTAVTIAGTAAVILFVAGARFFHLAFLGSASIPLLYYAIMNEDYRRERFLAFLDPWKDPTRHGWQIIQSLYALGTGGPFGTGIGFSRQKWFYLPQPDTDFIFAVLGEELGFLGSALVLFLFFTVAWRGYRAAMAAPDRFSCLLAAGLTTVIVLQAIINIGVATGSLPITGITLPFISYGGSSLLISLASAGILLNISRYASR
jgi:cell division protein FtsW